MKLSELINHVGDENIGVQSLLGSVTQATANKKNGTTLVTFRTDQVTPNDLLFEGKNKIGLVLWIPKDKLPKN